MQHSPVELEDDNCCVVREVRAVGNKNEDGGVKTDELGSSEDFTV